MMIKPHYRWIRSGVLVYETSFIKTRIITSYHSFSLILLPAVFRLRIETPLLLYLIYAPIQPVIIIIL